MTLTKGLGPSARVARLFRLAALGGIRGRVARSLLLSFHSCDVSPGAKFRGTIRLPHPFGIVVGAGAVIGANVTLCQNVTIGHTRAGGYPTIGDGVTVFPGAIIVGGITIGEGAIVGPNSLVIRDVPPGARTRAPLAEIIPAA